MGKQECCRECCLVPEDVGLSSEVLAHIDGVMDMALSDKTLTGMVTLIARHGKIAHCKAYGYADEGKPMQVDNIFRIASMSKAVGTVALLRLQDQGRILISDPVENYFPKFKDAKVALGGGKFDPVKRPVTVHDLLSMTGGLAATWSGGHPGADFYVEELKKAGIDDHMLPLNQTVRQIADVVSGIPLAAQPGERWEYSNLSMLVATAIVEIVSGMSIDEYLKQHVFEPLAMRDTSFFPDKASWDRMAAVYECGTGRRLDGLDTNGTDDTQLPFSDVRVYHNTAGGLMGTAYDYFRFAQMLLNGGELDGKSILSRNAVKMMSTNHIGGMRDYFYGHAWGYMVNVEENYNTQFNYMGLGSWGWHGYWGTVFNIWPEEDMLAIFLSQCSPESPSWKTQERFLTVAASAIMDSR